MKKIIITLGLVLLIGGSVYTVYNYNKTKSNTPNDSISQQNSSLESNSNSTNNNLKLKQYITNAPPTNQTIEESSIVKATDFKLKDLNGNEVSLSDYKGKKIFLNFWATWCPPCKAEMPSMEALYQETKDSDLVILAVNLNEDKPTVQKFMTENNYNFPVLLDTNYDVGGMYQAVSIPTSFFIDKEGNIVSKHVGAMTLENIKSYVNNIK